MGNSLYLAIADELRGLTTAELGERLLAAGAKAAPHDFYAVNDLERGFRAFDIPDVYPVLWTNVAEPVDERGLFAWLRVPPIPEMLDALLDFAGHVPCRVYDPQRDGATQLSRPSRPTGSPGACSRGCLARPARSGSRPLPLRASRGRNPNRP